MANRFQREAAENRAGYRFLRNSAWVSFGVAVAGIGADTFVFEKDTLAYDAVGLLTVIALCVSASSYCAMRASIARRQSEAWWRSILPMWRRQRG